MTGVFFSSALFMNRIPYVTRIGYEASLSTAQYQPKPRPISFWNGSPVAINVLKAHAKRPITL
jgi:hypothetical protein